MTNLILVLLLLISSTSSFSLLSSFKKSSLNSLCMHNNNDNNNNKISSIKTSVQSSISSLSKAILSLASTSLLLQTINVKPALAGVLDDCNTKLNNYGLPPIVYVPPGFTPLVAEIGRGSAKKDIKNPVVVQFAHPGTWVEATTTVNNNGEAGTISANDYMKGDSAFFFTAPSTDKITLDNKSLIQKFILKSLSQKGDVLDSFKVENIRAGPKGVNGQEYTLVDISYTLNTEAGFFIDRKGVASLTNVGDFIQGLVCVTTKLRFNGKKELGATLRDIAESFRVYKLDRYYHHYHYHHDYYPRYYYFHFHYYYHCYYCYYYPDNYFYPYHYY